MNEVSLLNVRPFQETLHAGMCGPAVLKMVLDYYGIQKTEEELAQLAGTSSQLGTDDNAVVRVLGNFGLQAEIHNNSTLEDMQAWLDKEVPVIVDWFTRGRSDYSDSEVPDGHYSVVVGLDGKNIYLQDPEIGRLRTIVRDDFMKVWFDFRGESITSWSDMIIRQLVAVYSKGSNL